jgi:hypothetical protein
MSITLEKIAVSCPQCGQQLVVPASALGKQGRCPSCKHIFPLEAPVAAQTIEPPPPQQGPNSIWDEVPGGEYHLQPLPPSPSTPVIPNPYIPPTAQTTKGKYRHGFGWEHRALDAGMMGGLGMMAIAVVWFLLGFFCLNRIFFYPPILFIFGLVGFLKGLFTGNISGR